MTTTVGNFYFIASLAMNNDKPSGFWDDAEVISIYSREQAIADGVLVDVTPTGKEAGFKVPVAVTAAVWAILDPSQDDAARGQSATGRLWDVLMMLRANARNDDTVLFDVLIAESDKHRTQPLKAVIGPGDDVAPVITIMLPNED